MRLIGGAGVPAGAVLDIGDLLAEPSFEARGIIQTMQHPNRTLRRLTFPVRFDGAPAPVKAGAAARPTHRRGILASGSA